MTVLCLGVFVLGLVVGATGTHRALARALRKLWHAWTWRPVACDGCGGTGLCATLQDGKPPTEPHSCCACSGNTWVPRDRVPAGFKGNERGDMVFIGNGVAWRRPWSSTQYDERTRVS